MYCPNCASPIDNVKFCRSCGANVSLVPVALTGQLPAAEEEDRRDRRHRKNPEPSIESAWRSIFAGFGFIAVAFAVMRYFPGGGAWWFWLFIPAFGAIGKGVGQLVRLKNERQAFVPRPVTAYTAPTIQPPPEIKAPTTSQLAPPSSVVEETTRHLEEAQRN